MAVSIPDGAVPKKGGLLKGARSIYALAGLLAVLAMFGALSILGSAADQVSYYVLKAPVAARTQITPTMLTEVKTSNGGQPRTAYDLAWVQTNQEKAFTRIALRPGDTITASNVGPLTRITDGIPNTFVAASFAADPSDAVAGKVRRGDYIEIAAISEANAATGNVSKIVMHHVLVLDVTVAPATIAAAANDGQAGANLAPGPESAAVRGGIPSLYSVAVSPGDFTKLVLLKGKPLAVALSPNRTDSTINASSGQGDVFGDGPVADSGAGTVAVQPDPASQSQPGSTTAPVTK